jgi:hypothetical protein
LGEAADSYLAIYSAHCPPLRCLTLKEAINGSDEFSGIKRLDLSHSSGYPLNLYVDADKPGKHTFFVLNPDGEYDLIGLGLQEYWRARHSLEAGQDPEFYFQVSLKDEKRSASKIAARSTRTVQVAPLAHSLLMREYFGALLSHMKLSFATTPSAVGMNVQSSDWQDMIMWLS